MSVQLLPFLSLLTRLPDRQQDHLHYKDDNIAKCLRPPRGEVFPWRGRQADIDTWYFSLSLCLSDLWLIHMMPCNVKQMLVKLRTLNECVMCWVHFWQCCSHSEPDLQLDYERQMYFQFSWKLVVSMIGYMTGFVFSAAVLYHLWQTAPVFVRTFWVIPLQANSWFSY